MDKETLQNQIEGEKVLGYVTSDAWKYIKDRFTEQIMDLQSIRNLDGTLKPEEIVLDIKARNTAVDILQNIIREIEGRADQHRGNKDLVQADEDIGYIT